jgi:2'-5' RNA ligase
LSPGTETRPAPLILTLGMDDASQTWFDNQRRAHFPPERNHLAAHLTLFHHLPGDRMGEIFATVEEACRQQEPMVLKATGLLLLGRGVAYKLESPELEALRRRLAKEWEPWLTAQDQQGLRPHVTVQNKVAPEEARALREELMAGFSPFEVGGEGLLLWRYLGGPWERVGGYPFEESGPRGAGRG